MALCILTVPFPRVTELLLLFRRSEELRLVAVFPGGECVKVWLAAAALVLTVRTESFHDNSWLSSTHGQCISA